VDKGWDARILGVPEFPPTTETGIQGLHLLNTALSSDTNINLHGHTVNHLRENHAQFMEVN